MWKRSQNLFSHKQFQSRQHQFHIKPWNFQFSLLSSAECRRREFRLLFSRIKPSV